MTAGRPDRNGGTAHTLDALGRVKIVIPVPHSPRLNHLLDTLPAVDYERIADHLELIPLRLGDVLHEPGVRMRYVYFLTTAIVSLLYVMEDGASSAEIAIVGNEGIIGISLFMGGETTPSRAVVQSAGYGFRLRRSC